MSRMISNMADRSNGGTFKNTSLNARAHDRSQNKSKETVSGISRLLLHLVGCENWVQLLSVEKYRWFVKSKPSLIEVSFFWSV